MGRQYRSARQGQSVAITTVTVASSTLATVPTGRGLSILSTAVGADFTLMPPEEGVEAHVAVGALVTTGGIILRACTAGSTTITFSSTSADNVLKFDRAGPNYVSLIGLNSTRWIVRGLTPVSTAVITGTS